MPSRNFHEQGRGFPVNSALAQQPSPQQPTPANAAPELRPATGAVEPVAKLDPVVPRPAETLPQKRAELYRVLGHYVDELEKRGNVVKLVSKLICPTVVHVEADAASLTVVHGQGRRIEEKGSGVIIAYKDKHYVLTNGHVIRGATLEGIRIHLADGRVIRPTRVWQDAATDVGVMAVSAPDLVAAPLGDSNNMEIGDFVLAVGSPWGLTHSVTYGIISAKGRRNLDLGSSGVRYQDFLQTDAAINPGNSGGPLVNLRGEVIGVNTAIASSSGGSEGVGFTIPINMFMYVARQLIENGRVARAFLGVNLDSQFGSATAIELGLPRPFGARVKGITPKSPAEAARLQVGDVILRFGEIPVEDDSHLVNLVSMTDIGKEVPLLIYRDRKPMVLRVAVGDRNQFEPPR